MRHRIPAVGGIPGGLIADGVVVSLLMFASDAAADLAAGFLTRADDNAAVAAAQKSPVP